MSRQIEILVAAVGKQDALATIAVCMDFGGDRDMDGIACAVHPDSCCSRAYGQNIGSLRDVIVSAVNMQTDAKRHLAVSGGIGRTFCISGRKSLYVVDGLPIAVDRMPKICLPVDIVAQILHSRQIYFHKACIIAIGPMAHHACRLKVGTFEILLVAAAAVFLESVDRYARNAVEGCPCQSIRYMVADKIGEISLIHNETIRWLDGRIFFFQKVEALRGHDEHARLSVVAVLVYQMIVPGIRICDII